MIYCLDNHFLFRYSVLIYSANMSYSTIWSPAAIAPSVDLMSSNSCMQRAAAYNHHHHHQMATNTPPTGAVCYSSQGYGPASAYYGNHMADYHHPMSGMPHMSHHSQLGASMNSAALNQMAGPPMSAHMNTISSHGLHPNSHLPASQQTRSSPHNGSLHAGGTDDCAEYAEKWKFHVL